MRVARAVVLTIIGLTLCTVAGAAELPGAGRTDDTGRPQPTFRSGIEVVALAVTVLDAKQHLVSDLQRPDFEVYEDGVRQELTYFETSEVPMDLALLVDTSISMEPKLPFVRTAAEGVVGRLRAADRVSIMAFNDHVRILSPFTGDREAIGAALAATKAGGGTALYNGIYVALREFRKGMTPDAPVRRRAIVVLSDGEDTASVLSFEELMAEARRAGVTIYTIGLRTDPLSGYQAARTRRFFSQADFAMKRLAQETGATSHFPERPADIQTAYDAIGQELGRQYAIGYVSSNPMRNGAFRRVQVRITDRPDVRSRTRLGYVAGSAGELASR